MSNRKLTEAEIEALGEDYRRLLVQTDTQTREQRAFLRTHIQLDPNISAMYRAMMVQEVDSFKHAFVTITGRKVQVVYEFSDLLHQYLSKGPTLPVALRGFLSGGVDIVPEDGAVDPQPKTGKTKRS